MIFCIEGLQAQVPMGVSYEAARQAPDMQWVCPEIEKYQSLFNSIRNEDYKIYADKIKENIELYTDPSSPANKYLVTQAVLNIENPLFSTENLLNYISNWIKKNKGWEKAKVDLDKDNKKIVSSATIHVANHSTFLDVYKVSVTPNLAIQLIEGNQLLVSFLTDSYKNDVYDSHNKYSRTFREKISDVYPFVPKSSYKITYAKAYVGTYLYFWDFISNLYNDLNANYSRDAKMLAQLHYDYSKDSLVAMYGEPTKVIADQKTCPDVNNEIHFYEKAQKVVFMGKTIDFKDIISCEIVDDPQFIPGRSTTLGAGISFFGFGFGGAETYRTPDKTVHNYVVDVKIDSMVTPFIRIATGQNEQKATEIASTFEYILRHQQENSKSESQKTRTTTRRTRR